MVLFNITQQLHNEDKISQYTLFQLTLKTHRLMDK